MGISPDRKSSYNACALKKRMVFTVWVFIGSSYMFLLVDHIFLNGNGMNWSFSQPISAEVRRHFYKGQGETGPQRHPAEYPGAWSGESHA